MLRSCWERVTKKVASEGIVGMPIINLPDKDAERRKRLKRYQEAARRGAKSKRKMRKGVREGQESQHKLPLPRPK